MSMESEVWRAVVGYEGVYSVSNLGQVRSEARTVLKKNGQAMFVPERILKNATKESGHLVVSLHKSGHQTTKKVHQLVMEAFVGPRPEDADCLHINGVHADNRLANLRYGTRSENVLDMVEHGVHNHARKTHCKWGHPFDAVNTYISPSSGQRVCRTCKANEGARRYQERKAAKLALVETPGA